VDLWVKDSERSIRVQMTYGFASKYRCVYFPSVSIGDDRLESAGWRPQGFYVQRDAVDVGDLEMFSFEQAAMVREISRFRLAAGLDAGFEMIREDGVRSGMFLSSRSGFFATLNLHEPRTLTRDWNRVVREIIGPLIEAKVPVEGYQLSLH
jgi:hypothetical protein